MQGDTHDTSDPRRSSSSSSSRSSSRSCSRRSCWTSRSAQRRCCACRCPSRWLHGGYRSVSAARRHGAARTSPSTYTRAPVVAAAGFRPRDACARPSGTTGRTRSRPRRPIARAAAIQPTRAAASPTASSHPCAHTEVRDRRAPVRSGTLADESDGGRDAASGGAARE